MVSDQLRDGPTVKMTLEEFDSTALLREPGRVLWECTQDPELGWIVLAVDRRVQYPMFCITLSKEHQNSAYAKELCDALARVYNRTDNRA